MQRILFIFFFTLQLSATLVQAQTIRYITPDGTGNGTSWADASSIEDAVANAANGDELWLLEGDYEILSTITFNKTLEILGGFSGSGDQRDPALYPSVIDGQAAVHMIETGSLSSNTLFDGISFINGYANTDVDDIKGGALSIQGNGTQINNCVFRNNISENRIGSGAIYLWSADDVVIENSLFENNRVIQTADGSLGGGAIHVRFGSNTSILNTIFRSNYSFYVGGAVDDWGANTLFEDCVFEGNESGGNGGVVYVRGNDTYFANCVFEDNTSEGSGGGVYVNNHYTRIADCNFIGNRGTDGGALASNGGIEVSASYFEGNQAHGNGGAIYNYRFAELSIIERTRFSANTADLGGAIYNFSEEGLKIISSLFEANQATDEGGAIFNNRFIEIANTTFVVNINTALVHNRFQTTGVQTTVYNSIFYLNTAKSSSYLADIAPTVGGSNANPDESDKDVRNNIVQEFSEGSNNQVGVNPQFVNAAGGDYRLSESSPAIDAGDENLYNDVSDIDAANSVDLDGNDRLFGDNIDMGAYELQEEPVETVPNCTAITLPLDGATDVSLLPTIQWDAVTNATGYRLTIGTTATGGEVLNNEDVGNVTNYTLTADLEENTVYYIHVVPYNNVGEATGCSEISFTTETLSTIPDCTNITAPTNGTEDVALDADITWNAVDGADGYRIFIGTSPGGTDIVNGDEVTDTFYSVVGGFEENTTYYVTVVPFNTEGDASGCAEISFTTVALPVPPQADDQQFCPPATVAELVATGEDIRWYDQAVGGTALSETTALSTGTYYATQTVDGMESDRRAVAVTVEAPEAPLFNGDITGCGNVTVADLEDEFPGLRWYSQATGGTALSSTEAVSTGTYYASRVSGTCESDRTAVQVIISVTPVPVVPGQTFIVGSTFADLDITGQNLRWYTEPIGGTPFDPQTVISNGTFYASQTIDGCESDRVIVEINITSVPNCATNITPVNNATDVPVDANITWDAVSDADGYYVNIGTTSGGTELINNANISGTSYNPTTDFPENTTIYITVIPYNTAGNASDCSEISFTTAAEEVPSPIVPECTTIIHPQDGEHRGTLPDGIVWLAVDGADGYRVSIGTTLNGTDVVDNVTVTGTTFNPMVDFTENTPYYLLVTPFNAAGEAVGCDILRFLIIPDTPPGPEHYIGRTKYGISPNGDGINDFWKIDGIEYYPDNTVSIYNRWGDLVFQLSNYDNQSRMFDGNANKLTRLGAGILPSGTYFFTIQYRGSEETKKVEGMLVIKR